MDKFKGWGGVSTLAGVAMAACFGAMTALPSLRGPSVVPFLAFFFIASAAYAIAVIRLGRDRLPLALVWAFAVLFRLALLLTTPTLSDDIYRYLWDGRLVSHRVNPYAHPVDDPALAAYDDPFRELVNHPWMASPYLPAAQALFGLLSWIAPASPTAFQVAAAALDLASAWLVMGILGVLGLPRRRVLILLWNPLAVVEFAHGAHIDAWMIFLTLLAFWLLARAGPQNHRRGLLKTVSTVALAAATLTKPLPALLAPLLLHRWGWRRVGLYTALVLGVCALFASGAGWGLHGPLDGRGLFGALRIYLRQWNFNSGVYHWLEVLLTGYQTPGGVPLEPSTEGGILLAKFITTALLVISVLAAALWSWRIDGPARDSHERRTLALLRLAVVPIGAYLLLTATLHPWYLTAILPFAVFLLPAEGETPHIERFAWPWLYLSCAVALSYVTYIDPEEFQEFYFVRWVEYLPFFVLVIWAGWPAIRRWIIHIQNRK